MLMSCEKEESAPKYLEINRVQKELNTGYIHDAGTNDDLTYRLYKLSFVTTKDNPSDYLAFYLYSTSTKRLQEGDYYYTYSDVGPGSISYVSVGQGIEYDNIGVAVEGLKIYDYNSEINGFVSITMKDEVYKFVFDLSATKSGETYSIKGEFNEVLQEGNLYLK